ncbi:hypothetical protein MHK_002776, partial [Candidatus Magnetomorum sp. HK-1]
QISGELGKCNSNSEIIEKSVHFLKEKLDFK